MIAVYDNFPYHNNIMLTIQTLIYILLGMFHLFHCIIDLSFATEQEYMAFITLPNPISLGYKLR